MTAWGLGSSGRQNVGTQMGYNASEPLRFEQIVLMLAIASRLTAGTRQVVLIQLAANDENSHAAHEQRKLEDY